MPKGKIRELEINWHKIEGSTVLFPVSFTVYIIFFP